MVGGKLVLEGPRRRARRPRSARGVVPRRGAGARARPGSTAGRTSVMRQSSESRGDGIRAPDCVKELGASRSAHRDGGNTVRGFTRIAVGVVTVAALATPLLASHRPCPDRHHVVVEGHDAEADHRLREGRRVTARATAVRRRCPDGDQGPEEEGHQRRLRAHPRVGRGRRPGGDGLPRGRSEESRRLAGADCQPAVRDLAEGRRVGHPDLCVRVARCGHQVGFAGR